jgi:hypothetical protein
MKVIKTSISQNFSKNINESDSIDLNCNILDKLATDEKLVKINWILNTNQFINLTKNKLYNQNNSLELNQVELNESGSYECHAETNFKNYLTIINLTINERVSKLDSKNMIVRASKEKSVVLDCTWWFNQNNLLFNNVQNDNLTEWRLNGSLIDEKKIKDKYEYLDTYNTLLKINNLKLEENNDIYSCIFKQNKQDVKLSNFSLFIGVGPYVSEENIELNNTIKWFNKYESARIDCPIEGSPTPNKTWLFNSSYLKEDDFFKFQIEPYNSTLKLFELDEISQGIYVCNASNEFGSVNLRYKVQIASK